MALLVSESRQLTGNTEELGWGASISIEFLSHIYLLHLATNKEWYLV